MPMSPISSQAADDLLKRCMAWVHRFVALSAQQEAVIAAWVLHTWVIDAAEWTPYLHVTAPEKGCGKTRLLEVLETIVCHPCRTGGMSPAALLRTVDADSPTLLLDEIDAAFGGNKEMAEALRGILNEGAKRGGNFRKCNKMNHEMQTFNAFGAKAIAGIGALPDTVTSRSIVIAMRRQTTAEKVERFRERNIRAEVEELKAALQAWATPETIAVLGDAKPLLPEQLTDRQMDIIEPLLAIADFAGGAWPEQLRAATLALFGSIASEDNSIGVQLLRDIRSVFDGRATDTIFSANLAADLCDMDGQPWADWLNGKGLNANRLAQQLKKYGITSGGTLRIGNETRKGYRRECFEEAWSSYCPVSSVTSVTPVTTPVNIRDSESDCPSQSRRDGPFAAQRAGLQPRFPRHTSAAPHTANPRQSETVTDVTYVTPQTGTAPPEAIALPRWEDIGVDSAAPRPTTTPPPANASSADGDFFEVDYE
jgi:hypothetical protein